MPDYRKAARKAAQHWGVNPRVFERQIQQESGFNPNARSPAGAQGIAQFIPSTAREYKVNLNDNRAWDDLNGAAHYLHDALQRTGGDYKQALSIYNSGRPDGYKRFGETANYVRTILGGSSPSSGGSGSQGGSRVETRTTPGVDNSDARRALLLNYLTSGQRYERTGLLQLKQGLDANQDTPATTKTTTVRVPNGAATGRRRYDLKELFWQGPGGIDIKNNTVEPQGFVSGHTDHVHVASGPRQILALARLAEKIGLHVGENPAFGGVDPVHAERSYHYRIKLVNGRKVGEAIDVSGPPEQMRKYARRVAAMRK